MAKTAVIGAGSWGTALFSGITYKWKRCDSLVDRGAGSTDAP